MDEHFEALREAIALWRSREIGAYWWQIDYIGAALNRMGVHTLTFVDNTLWHQWHGEWRRITTGSDFWLFSVPGSFAWVRDMLTKVLPESGAASDGIELRFNQADGHLEYMRVTAAKRDAANFTFEVKHFGEGPHPEYDGTP